MTNLLSLGLLLILALLCLREVIILLIRRKSSSSQQSRTTFYESSQILNKVYNAIDDALDVNVVDSVGVSTAQAEYTSPSDFTAAYASSTTITLSSLPITIVDSSQIIYVKQIKADNSSEIYVNGNGTYTLTESSGTLTIYGAGTPFVSGDIYEVGINGQMKGYDASNNLYKIQEQSPPWSHYTDKVELIPSAQTLTTAFANLGGEIDMRGENQLGLWLEVDINDAEDVEIRVLHKHTSGGTEEYREIYLGSPAANITTIHLNDYQVASDADQLFKLNIPVSATSPYIQVQARERVNEGTDADIDTAYITKAWAS